MTPTMLVQTAIRPGLFLLPDRMHTPEAVRMLVAIAHQESALQTRGAGPTHGLWGFDMRRTAAVMSHADTSWHAQRACELALYGNDDLPRVFDALEDNDVLAAAFARLLLWPMDAPLADHVMDGWAQYKHSWRPERPKGERWPTSWAAGDVALILGMTARHAV